MSAYPVAALDIECQNWDTFVDGAMRFPDGDVRVFDDEDELFDEVLSYEGDIWTWAGGRYDSIWLARRAALRGIHASARLGGGGVVSLKLGRATVRDGFRLYPVALAKASRLSPVRKSETGLDCRCGRACGGYCRISRRMPARERQRLREYLVQDTHATAATVATIAQRFDEWGLVLKNTIGSSAWATMRDVFGVPESPFTGPGRWRDWQAAARGYHGGRTEMYRRSAPVIWRYDLHAAYPAALQKTAVPVGDYQRHVGPEAARDFAKEKPGIYACTVRVPAMHVPPLPCHTDERLLYVTGTFSGSWPLPELQAALDLGVEILHFDESIVWERAEAICAPYMQHVWNLRAKYLAEDKDSPEAGLLKYAANAPTGKVGQNPESEVLELAPDPDDVVSCPADSFCFGGALHGSMQECCAHECRGTCKAWEALDVGHHVDGEGVDWPVVYSRPVWTLSDCSNVQMAAYLTGVTRVEIGAQWRHAAEALCYGDTDSTLTTRPLTRRLGDDLGEHGLDGIGLDYLARGPKAYRYAEWQERLKARDVERLHAQGLPGERGQLVVSGEYKVRSKGVPLDDALVWDRWAGYDERSGALAPEGEAVALEGGVWGIKGGARRGAIFIRRDMSRAAKNSLRYAGSREVLADGSTRPLDYDEYVALVEKGDL